MKKRGIILPTVLVLIAILVLLALTRHFFSRQQMHFSDLLSEKEQAYYIAAGLREIAVRQLATALDHCNSADPATFPKLEKCSTTTRTLLENLLSVTGEPAGKEFTITFKSPALKEYIEMVENSGVKPAESEVKMSFIPGKPLFENAPRGIISDPNEIFWKLILRCRVKIEHSEATAVWYREGRTISIQPSVFGKFTFFLLEPESAELNLNHAEKIMPLVINNGQSTEKESISPDKAADFFDKQGWVYLGENTETDLRLNRHSPLLNTYFFISPLDSSEYLASLGTFAWYYFCDVFDETLKRSADGIAPFAESAEDQFIKTSSILFNGSLNAPSPTVVIGRVLRSYPVIQGLTGKKSGKRFPFPAISEATFSSTDWPCRLKPAETEMIKKNFNHDFNKYSQRMSFIYQEPFNAGNFQALELGKIHREFAILQPSALPPQIGNPPVSRLLKTSSAPTGFFDLIMSSAYSLSNDQGRKLLHEASFAALNDISFFKQRASLTCSDLNDLIKKTAGPDKILKIPGAVYIAGDLEIDRPLNISDAGGMILVQGQIKISAPIITGKKALLTIISLGGDIAVAEKTQIDAGLIALSGKLNIERECTINGSVACRSFRFKPEGSFSSRINYNHASDPTSSKAAIAAYRLCPDEKEFYLVE